MNLKEQPSDYETYIKAASEVRSESAQNAEISDFFLSRNIYLLGSGNAEFSIRLASDGKATVSDNLPASFSLINFPHLRLNDELIDSENLAFHWAIAKLSCRSVINRPDSNAPFSNTFNFSEIELGETNEERDFSGQFIYLNGEVALTKMGWQADHHTITSTIILAIQSQLKKMPYLLRGNWSIRPTGEVRLNEMHLWCDWASLKSFFEQNN